MTIGLTYGYIEKSEVRLQRNVTFSIFDKLLSFLLSQGKEMLEAIFACSKKSELLKFSVPVRNH